MKPPPDAHIIGTIEGVLVAFREPRSYFIPSLDSVYGDPFWWELGGKAQSFQSQFIVDIYTPEQEAAVLQFIRAHYNLHS